jgi:hypothetical protein
MAEQEKGGNAQALIIGGLGGATIAGIAALLLSKPAKAAPSDEKLDYIVDCQAQLVQDGARAIELLEEIAAQGIPGGGQIQISVATPWVAKDPEHIFEQAIRNPGVFIADKMVDFTKGKRLLIKVESSLDQIVQVQLVGNIADTYQLATLINAPVPCAANGNVGVGLAWDDWHPFIGVQMTLALAPTTGIINVWAVIQE